ncbi:LuxR C-terminal-related transcriptional regulator [Paenibacillus mendelii]|uniref:LuxR C-terminal-related transcriptional regulator n=1 Tax=Paenibacillus mendelii TaxID=206163 RepID=A0ABV6J275_9BACL|nr:LuxR C-terminal-related transcriptional regulator [Paenibacillus mendelii]MCQ6560541.1 LuxR C-terminal-related transcriptional regulator [Paenibacillus mendelii]
MSTSILSTKLYIPPPRPKAVVRPRLIEHLNEGLNRRLTLVSASAGYGKTTLVSEWLAGCPQSAAWLSLDERDNDPARFLTYLIAALQTIAGHIGEGVLGVLQSPQLPPAESIITPLVNEICDIPDHFVLVLDDYHVIDDRSINHAVSFLIERMPPQMHMVIATREDPELPLARLRVRNQLTEVRAAELRFTLDEAAVFVSQVMGLNLRSEDVALLEARTEGWIAGLQLAALSVQGHQDPAAYIQAFTGSHHSVLDYLIEEVLQLQSASIQTFLLRTSILDRLCGPLCEAVLQGAEEHLALLASGQEILEYLERTNLFIVPLDNERRWYRYHHLFADLLRSRLEQSITTSSNGDAEQAAAEIAALHIRASIWHEDNGFAIEAFHHAAAAKDIRRAARLIEGEGMPLLFRGAVIPVMTWLASLPDEELNANPSLWVIYASALLMTGCTTVVEPKLQAAEKALQHVEQNDKIQDLIGHIAAIRASLAVSKHQADAIMAESRRALRYLHPNNMPVRTSTTWTLGYAYQLQGDRAAASKAYTEALSHSQRIGHVIVTIMASLGLGMIQETDNQLHTAAETYRSVLTMAGNPPLPAACEAHLGLARICYEWNDLDAALQHGQISIQLARQFEQTDRVVAGELFLARLKLALGEASSAYAILAKTQHSANQHNFMNQVPHIAAAQVLVLLHQGNPAAATQLAQKHELPISQARVRLAQGDTSSALAMLHSLREQAEAKGYADERLKVMVLQAVALHAHGDKLAAMQLIVDALTIAESGGFIRIFVDEGIPMYKLLRETADSGRMPSDIGRLLAEFEAEGGRSEVQIPPHQVEPAKSLIEPLSSRELEVLRLIAEGLSNRGISERLFIALTTVKGHNQMIFDKLQVKRRTEAVARARQLGLL